MVRKQITYARRKHRGRNRLALQTYSSPLQVITDSTEKLTQSEMARRMLKRSRHSGDIGFRRSPGVVDEHTGQTRKKPRLHEEMPTQIVFQSNEAYGLQTPYRTPLTEAQIFKLESSRGLSLPTDYEFSPVPLAPSGSLSDALRRPQKDRNQTTKSAHRTSSRKLKENIDSLPFRSSSKSGTMSSAIGTSRRSAATSFVPNARSRSKGTPQEMPLASPFTSQPSSPHYPAGNRNTKHITLKPTATSTKRTLSDTHFNPNLPTHQMQSQPHAQSTANSPVRQPFQDDYIKLRRPSAPSATTQRPDVASWFLDPLTNTNLEDHRFLSPSIFDLSGASSRGTSVDFNRPPSQLSYNSTYDEAFFADALKISTPFGATSQRFKSAIFSDSPDSTDEEDIDQTLAPRTLHSSHMRGALSLGPDLLGSWRSDSLISPPTFSQKSAYTRQNSLDKDIDMELTDCLAAADKEDSLDLGHGLEIARSRNVPVDHQGHASEKTLEDGESPATLQKLFDCLDIGVGGCNSHPPISRTRSLDLELDQSHQSQPLRSPVQISPSKLQHTSTDTAKVRRGGRDRRGTIRASDFAVLPGPTTTGLGEGPRRTRSGTIVQGSSHARRERSNTILARPPDSLTSSTAQARHPDDGDVDMLDMQENDGHKEMCDALMCADESDDELLLKDHRGEVDWVVAEPPSPQLPRRSTRKAKGFSDWRKRQRLGKGLGSWGVEEHDEDDGTDDPLLLK